MRISTNQLHAHGVRVMMEQSAELAKLQEQLATGRRVLTPADDPTNAAQALDLEQGIALTQRYQQNIFLARSHLETEERAVGSATDILQRVRELALQANNGLIDAQSRAGVAREIDERLNELMDIANSRDGNGEYIFAGYSTAVRPFVKGASTFAYQGDSGQRLLEIGPTRQIAAGDAGMNVFMAIPNGNGTFSVAANAANTGTGIIAPGTVTNSSAWVPDTYTLTFTSATAYQITDGSSTVVTTGTYTADAAIAFNGIQTSISGTPAAGDTFTIAPSTNRNLFESVQAVATALRLNTDSAASRAHFHNQLNGAMQDMDRAMENLVTVRAGVGARLNALEGQESMNDESLLTTQRVLRDILDLDYTEAVTRFSRQQTALQAAQQTFMQIQNLSLFNYLR